MSIQNDGFTKDPGGSGGGSFTPPTGSGFVKVTGGVLDTASSSLGATDITTAVQDLQTSASPQFAGINLGHASDTTLARSSAGVITVEGVEITTNTAAQTLTNKTLTAPKLASGGFIADANGNEGLIVVATASAVNEVTLTNAATGANPKLAATGGDSNIGLDLESKGTGSIRFAPGGTVRAQVGYTGILLPADSSNPGSCGIWRTGGAIVINSNNGTLVYFNNGSGTNAQVGATGLVFPNSVSPGPGSTAYGLWRDVFALYNQGGGGSVVNAAKLVSRANSTAYSLCVAPTGDVLRVLLQDSSSKRAVALVDASGTVTFEAGSHADYVVGSSPASGEVGVYILAGVLTIKPGSAGARSIAANVARAQA